MPFRSREAQTRIKHGILGQYAGAYGGIICQGVLRQRPAPDEILDLAYLDAFAGFGAYDGDADECFKRERVWGSPIIALRAFEAQATRHTGKLTVRVTGALVENDPIKFDELLQNLRSAGLNTPVRQVHDLQHVALGQISALHGDVREYLDDFLTALDEDAFLLAFVDPFGPAMPMRLLRKLVARDRTDAITLFPVSQIHRDAGSLLKTPESREPSDNGNIHRTTEHMGSEEWFEIARLNLSCEEATERYVAAYRNKLLSAANGLQVKNVGLSFASRSQTSDSPGYHLFLTTRNLWGAYRINDIVRSAEFEKHLEHWSDHESQRASEVERQGVYELELGVPHVARPAVGERKRMPVMEVKAAIIDRVPPGSHTVRQILQRLANTVFKEGEVRAGLRALKEDGRVSYRTLEGYNNRVDVLLPTQ